MLFFFKCFLIGIGKIMPGVSGALLAINFKIYEDIINAFTCFFNDWKRNLKLIIIFILGIFLAMIFGSGIILFLVNNYRFLTFMFFIGLISGGTYIFAKEIDYNWRKIVFTLIIVIFLLTVGNIYSMHIYIIKNNFIDCLIFFLAGVIEVLTSVIPGISGTAILMTCGLYDHVLRLISSIYDIDYVISNIRLYFSYGFGIIISLIITLYLVNYLLKYHRNFMYSLILGLSLGSTLLLIFNTFKIAISYLELVLGMIFLILGLLLSLILNKDVKNVSR